MFLYICFYRVENKSPVAFFQNGALGNPQGSLEEDDIGSLAEQPPQQHFSNSRPYPDLSLGYM